MTLSTILGIETSCDETAVAIVREGQLVLANVIASQAKLHNKTGGIVPEVAAREQVEQIIPCLAEALMTAELTMNQIDGIAVTRGPGLIGSLLTGTSAARTLAWLLEKPIIGVNHIEGHIYGNWLCASPNTRRTDIRFPVVVLTASGGHNELILMREHGTFELIGETLDDAAGEAFDKVARILGLGYPGGPAIARAALQGKVDAIHFPRAWLQEVSPQKKRPTEITNYNFSFSGLKTAVLREVEQGKMSVPDCAASFQEAVVDVLASKVIAAAKAYGAQELHLAGGVSANQELRNRVVQLSDGNIPVRFPEKIEYCTDNAAMIAAAGYFRFASGERDNWRTLDTTPTLPLTNVHS